MCVAAQRVLLYSSLKEDHALAPCCFALFDFLLVEFSQRVIERLSRTERGQLGTIEAIEALLAEELTIREGRRIKAALQMARLTPIKTLAGFDFSFQPSLDRNRITALAALDFIDRHEVVHLVGPPGTGKSHLAVALGVEAVRAGRSVYFSPLADIVDSLARADREGRLRERIRYLCRAQLLIIDEIGYLSVGAAAGNLFFQLINARYEKGAMILTSNRGFAEWGEVFGNAVVATALLDRLLHHAVVIQIEGASYRLREHVDLLSPARHPAAHAGAVEPLPRRRGRPPKATTANPHSAAPNQLVLRYVTEKRRAQRPPTTERAGPQQRRATGPLPRSATGQTAHAGHSISPAQGQTLQSPALV